MNSHNHPMFGSIGMWFYKYLAGTSVDTDGAGFDRIAIKPNPADGLDFVKSSLDTVRGLISIEWKKTGLYFGSVRETMILF